MLAALLAGETPLEALAAASATILSLDPNHGAEVHDKFRLAAAATGKSVEAATLEFGQSCPLEHSFPSAVHCLIEHADAMRANAAAGGDNVGRAGMLGAWLGAHLGVTAIPMVWRECFTQHAMIEISGKESLADNANN